MAFQLLAVLLLGVWGGMKLDAYFQLELPLLTITLSFLALFAALYLLIKDVRNQK